MTDAPPALKATVDAIKTAFADTGGATVQEVRHHADVPDSLCGAARSL